MKPTFDKYVDRGHQLLLVYFDLIVQTVTTVGYGNHLPVIRSKAGDDIFYICVMIIVGSVGFSFFTGKLNMIFNQQNKMITISQKNMSQEEKIQALVIHLNETNIPKLIGSKEIAIMKASKIEMLYNETIEEWLYKVSTSVNG